MELFTNSNCPKCLQIKKYLKENNIEFIEKNIDIDFKAMAFLSSKSISTVPVLKIDENLYFGKVDILIQKVREVNGN